MTGPMAHGFTVVTGARMIRSQEMATISAVAVSSLQLLQPNSSQSPPPFSLPRNLVFKFKPKPSNPFHVVSKSKWINQTRNKNSVRARDSASAYAENMGNILGEVDIFTATGESVLFKDLWGSKQGFNGVLTCYDFRTYMEIAVVALLRHFGCPCCWEFASILKEVKPRLDSAGVKLIAVGVGTPYKARILAERLPFPLDSLYADPERKVKFFSTFDSLQKAVKNYTIEATPDDRSSVLQQGGMFVFKGKQLLYSWKD